MASLHYFGENRDAHFVRITSVLAKSSLGRSHVRDPAEASGSCSFLFFNRGTFYLCPEGNVPSAVAERLAASESTNSQTYSKQP